MNVLFIEATTVFKELIWLRSQNVLKGEMQ